MAIFIEWGNLQLLGLVHAMIQQEDWRNEISVDRVYRLLRGATGYYGDWCLSEKTQKSLRVFAQHVLSRMEECDLIEACYKPTDKRAARMDRRVWRLAPSYQGLSVTEKETISG